MAENELVPDEAEHLFLRSGSAMTNSGLWLVGGLVCFGAAIVGLVLALLTKVDQLTLQMMTTLPTLLGIGAVAASRSLSKTPRQVSVGPHGLRIEGQRGEQSCTWDEIGWAMVAPTLMNIGSQLVIYDTRGKVVAKFGSGFDDFDSLADIVLERISGKGDDTSDQIQLRKAKRSAVFMVVASVAFLALAAVNAWMAHREQRAAALLESHGVPGEARIERRFMAPNGVTPRLEYSITAPDGSEATRNAEVTRDYWDALEGAATVPVIFVPAEPNISRLATGEVEDDDLTKRPAVIYGLSIAISCLCCLFLVAAVLQWRGWDIDIDSKTKKISIKRFGTGR